MSNISHQINTCADSVAALIQKARQQNSNTVLTVRYRTYIQPILHSLQTLTVESQTWIRENQRYDNPNDLYTLKTVTPTARRSVFKYISNFK